MIRRLTRSCHAAPNTHAAQPGATSARLGGILIVLVLGFLAAHTQALPSDRDQPIHIESDRAERDGRQGITVYQGDVRLRQGSLRIAADRLEVRTDADNEVQEVIAEGEPAEFEQQPNEGDELVRAQAHRVHYRVAQEQLELTTNAWLRQGEASMTGNRIDYDIASDRVEAEGDVGTDRPRIEMVLPPRNRNPQQD